MGRRYLRCKVYVLHPLDWRHPWRYTATLKLAKNAVKVDISATTHPVELTMEQTQMAYVQH